MIAEETDLNQYETTGEYNNFLGIGKGRKAKGTSRSGSRQERRQQRKKERQDRRQSRRDSKSATTSASAGDAQTGLQRLDNTVQGGLSAIQDINDTVGSTRETFAKLPPRRPVQRIEQQQQQQNFQRAGVDFDFGTDNSSPNGNNGPSTANQLLILLVLAGAAYGGYYLYQQHVAKQAAA